MLRFRHGGSPASASRRFRSRRWMVSDLGRSLGGKAGAEREMVPHGLAQTLQRRWFTGSCGLGPDRRWPLGAFGERASGRECSKRSLNPMGGACMKQGRLVIECANRRGPEKGRGWMAAPRSCPHTVVMSPEGRKTS